MSYNFQGITSDTLMLLEMNRFHNNKPFYEEHKAQINEGSRAQLGALTLDLADTLYEVDENILVNPKKVSRIRRDTRFTKDKTLYRDNVWVIWSRPMEQGIMAPGLWCEVSPRGVDNGVGFWRATPAFMAFYRADLIENADRFLEAFVPLLDAGYGIMGESYKREKPGTEKMPDALKRIYNLKELYFMRSTADVSVVASPAFVDDMKAQLKLMKGMYAYLDGLYARFKAQEK
ncbi:MAG: DUF2461 domain-containing protein [Clostridia bacterium]|nr:DUF2461 domain-containing protein [Clostridia bacterium]